MPHTQALLLELLDNRTIVAKNRHHILLPGQPDEFDEFAYLDSRLCDGCNGAGVNDKKEQCPGCLGSGKSGRVRAGDIARYLLAGSTELAYKHTSLQIDHSNLTDSHAELAEAHEQLKADHAALLDAHDVLKATLPADAATVPSEPTTAPDLDETAP